MLHEEIINMAREAGEYLTPVSEKDFAELQRFVALVVAKEREACALICDSVNSYDNPMTANDCADAIRARSNTSNSIKE